MEVSEQSFATNLSSELVFQSHLTALEICNQVLQMTFDLQKQEMVRKQVICIRLDLFVPQMFDLFFMDKKY